MALSALVKSLTGLASLAPALPQSATNGQSSAHAWSTLLTLISGKSQLGTIDAPKLPAYLTNNVGAIDPRCLPN